jgi:putative FmdB family regulatory protein
MIYDYVCKACEEEFVFEHSVKRKPRKKCPSCKKMQLRRQISSASAVILKGDCWEKDGYASKKSD